MKNIVPISSLIDLSGKTVIVTGGAQGIGLGIVYRLAEAGASVMIADFKEQEALQSAKDLSDKGWKVKFVKVDVSQEKDVKKMAEETVKVFGGIDILVNNAGIYPASLVEQMTAADFDKVIAVNLKGVFLCTKYASEQMIKQNRGGKIINVTSIDALHPSSVGLAHYDASKHGVWGFSKNVALELAPHKIWVNAIAPGAIETPGVTQGKPLRADILEKFIAKIPMQTMGQPDDIGKAALFLASELSSYMTGAQIVVDGGVLLS
ncbi:SDR family oxidoreductase [Candidatus Daviesbacteria bacterium]|nr:SDR family oxidoreductase [Candidatus Daviesbacteria bacterium]